MIFNILQLIPWKDLTIVFATKKTGTISCQFQ